jgi:hypothetical protein
MGFFDEVALRDGRPATPEVQTVAPAHLGPPQGSVLPTLLPSVRVLGRSDNARLALVGLRCWPEGVSFDVQLMCRQVPGAASARSVTGEQDWDFRFGVLFSDGRRAAARGFPAHGRAPAAEDTTEPPRVRLRPVFGGGGRFHRRWEFYLWPLPPRGRLTMVADWPAEGIPESYTELDAGDIRSASARAVVVWRDLRDAGHA